jgi:hypothetical protein
LTRRREVYSSFIVPHSSLEFTPSPLASDDLLGSLVILYNGSLMVHDLPPVFSSSPDGRSTRSVAALKQRVCQEVIVGRNFKTLKVTSLPIVFVFVGGTLLQFIEDILPAVTAS